MNNLAAKNTAKSSNKWLMLLLLIAIVLSVWTALYSDKASEVDTIELSEQTKTLGENIQNSSKKKQTVENKGSQNEVSPLSRPMATNTNNNLIPWQKLKRERSISQAANLFEAHSWLEVPQIKKTRRLPTPPPVAPVAPFTYMGKLEDTPKGTQVFLMANGRLFSVLQGEKIDQYWRLDAEDANSLRLTYLPLNLPQILSKSATNASAVTVIDPTGTLPAVTVPAVTVPTGSVPMIDLETNQSVSEELIL